MQFCSFLIDSPLSFNYDDKACKISRDIYIDVSVLSALCVSSLYCYTPIRTNYLKNFFRTSFVLLHSPVHIFFLDFLTGFFVQNKMAFFGIGRKNTFFNVSFFLTRCHSIFNRNALSAN